jgi:hypothetical protein
VIFVNGEEQITAKLKDQPWREGTGGRIDGFETTPAMDYLSMTGLEKAYPGKEMQSWQRQIILEKPSLAIVLDRIGSGKDAEIRSRIHPGGDLSMEKGYFTIGSDKGAIAMVPFSERQVNLESGRQGSLSVNEQDEFQWIPYVDAVVRSNSSHTVTGYIMFPLEGENDPEAVVTSLDLDLDRNGEVGLTFILAGEVRTISFPGINPN